MVWDACSKPKGLLCGHVNACSIKNKREQFEHLLCDSNIDCFGTSETWLKPKSAEALVLLPGYKVFRKDRNYKTKLKGGGVLL